MTVSFSSNEPGARLARSAWFRSAPAAMQAQLVEAGRVERLAAGQRLFTRGDSDDGLYCVLDGLVRIGAASSTGKEALLAVHDFGFKEMKLHSIEAHINPANTASAAILESAGYIREAYFREDYFFNGIFLDSAIYSLLEKR